MTCDAPGTEASVLVVDDDPFVRRALAAVIDDAHGLRLVGTAENGAAGVELAERLAPDLVLMDLEMPVMTGLEATRRLCGGGPGGGGGTGGPTVVMLTVRASDDAVVACLRAGAAGFLLKTADPEEIAGALRRAAEGEAVLSPEVTRRMVDAVRAGGVPGTGDSGTGGGAAGATAQGAASPLVGVPGPVVPEATREKAGAWRAALTEREQEVAEAVAAGMSNQQIADALYMSLSTAKTNVSRILAKLGLDNRVQVALLVNGLLDDPTEGK